LRRVSRGYRVAIAAASATLDAVEEDLQEDVDDLGVEPLADA
jgi:4-aminobutyrate aminotransferase-like enzyme